MQNYEQRGDVITITAGADITSGQVVKVGHLLGVACADIADGAQGEVAITGVYNCPKVSGAEIAAGEPLTWDVSANTNTGAFDDKAASPATGDVTGAAAVAVEAAGAGVTTIAVRFTGVPGTVT